MADEATVELLKPSVIWLHILSDVRVHPGFVAANHNKFKVACGIYKMLRLRVGALLRLPTTCVLFGGLLRNNSELTFS